VASAAGPRAVFARSFSESRLASFRTIVRSSRFAMVASSRVGAGTRIRKRGDVYGTLAWPLWRAAPLKAGGEAIVDGFVRLTRPPSKWSSSMTGATGAQSSIMNSCSATANLELRELCPSLGTLVNAGAAEEARAQTIHWEQSVVGEPGPRRASPAGPAVRVRCIEGRGASVSSRKRSRAAMPTISRPIAGRQPSRRSHA
jgi:hypothetical protein